MKAINKNKIRNFLYHSNGYIIISNDRGFTIKHAHSILGRTLNICVAHLSDEGQLDAWKKYLHITQ
jgi:hypothetical protein